MTLPYRTHIRVQVTQADIDAGHRAKTDSCPIAIALRRNYPEARVSTMGWWVPTIPHTFRMSEAAVDFAFAFDAGKRVEPQTFIVEGPGR